MTHESAGVKVIETSCLSKRFGSLKAVDRVSLNVDKGEIYGFLGLNGAGKTTTIRMLLGMVRPLSGDVSILGHRLVRGRAGPWGQVGYLVESPHSYPELTVWQNLQAVCKLRRLEGTQAADDIIERLQLSAYRNTKARNLSSGNNQRLGLAKALIHRPELLILDEPTNGLDPSGIVEIRELLTDFAKNRGVAVFISSHNLGEIDRFATRIGIIHKGALVREINTDSLQAVLRKSLVLDMRDREKAAAFLASRGYAVGRSAEGTLMIEDQKACERPEEINERLVQAGLPPFHVAVAREDLESYFLRAIGEKA